MIPAYVTKTACFLLDATVIACCAACAVQSDHSHQPANAAPRAAPDVAVKSAGGLPTFKDCVIRGGNYAVGAIRVEARGSYYLDRSSLRAVCILPPRIRRLGSQRVYLPMPSQIMTSVYDFFTAGTETANDGLFSYVLFPVPSRRAERFLYELLASTSYLVDNTIALRYLNVMYLPTHKDRFEKLVSNFTDDPRSVPQLAAFAAESYDYAFARKLLSQICAAPAATVQEVCASDLSRGPYLFTYSRPLSVLETVPPPYLFVDLSGIHDRAFSEFVAAFKQQVKDPDYTDRQKIDSFRLDLLNIVLTAADWADPIKRSLTEIIHFARSSKE
jgi:hypothetical protein